MTSTMPEPWQLYPMPPEQQAAIQRYLAARERQAVERVTAEIADTIIGTVENGPWALITNPALRQLVREYVADACHSIALAAGLDDAAQVAHDACPVRLATSLPAAGWDGRIADIVAADHPHTDPGDGRTECSTCGKWVWPVTHSCSGVPVTEAARRRYVARLLADPSQTTRPEGGA